MNAFLFSLGLLVVVATWANVLATMVLPRRPAGFNRASLSVNRAVRLAFLALARFASSFGADGCPPGSGCAGRPPQPTSRLGGRFHRRVRTDAAVDHP